jgi:hypothetical protein
MGGWCGVCDGAAKGRRAKAGWLVSARPSRPSDSLALSLAHLTAQQQAASRSAWLAATVRR